MIQQLALGTTGDAGCHQTERGGSAPRVTKPARTAGLVEENADGEPTQRAEVLVFAFDRERRAVDIDRASVGDRAGLVASAARDTKRISQAGSASIQTASNGSDPVTIRRERTSSMIILYR